ncbi:MAG: hydrolase [Oscillospiraceae bacterium]|nr:hydrolase [Oscillospiraceae bacterium]
MGKFDGVLLASDYDDTLYGYNLEVSRENRQALRWFMAEGGHFCVATGRAHKTFTPQIARQELSINAPCVLHNGSLVYDYGGDRILYQTFLRQSAPEDMRQMASVFPSLGLEAYFEDEVYMFRPNRVTESHMERVGVRFEERAIEDMPGPWTKVILEQDHPLLLEAQRYIKEHWGGDYEAIFSNKYLLEVTRKGSTKGGMVLWIADYLGIDRAHIYCVGDNQNDLPMLEISAIPFAPANCAEPVRDWGARIMPSCDDHCIAAIIDVLNELY